MRRSVEHAVIVESARGWRLDKLKQSHKIDVVVALSLAALAAVRTGTATNYNLNTDWICGKSDEHIGMSPRAISLAEKREYANAQMRSYVWSGGGQRPWWSY
jgi:hypothetical protein